MGDAERGESFVVGCVAMLLMVTVSFVIPTYIGWRTWEWLGPTSWLFGEGFVWFCVKVIIALGIVGAGTKLLYVAVVMIVAAVMATFQKTPPQ